MTLSILVRCGRWGFRALATRDSYSHSGPSSERIGDAFRERATYERAPHPTFSRTRGASNGRGAEAHRTPADRTSARLSPNELAALDAWIAKQNEPRPIAAGSNSPASQARLASEADTSKPRRTMKPK